MNKQDFKYKIMFDKFKDKAFKNAQEFKKCLEGYDIDINNFYINVVNYQIKKYGHTLSQYHDLVTRETLAHDRILAKQRRYKRRNKK